MKYIVNKVDISKAIYKSDKNHKKKNKIKYKINYIKSFFSYINILFLKNLNY